ncbi:MAG: HD domain-containing protein [FCB group bacterium]|nr:HD domain-containing protein [FCB group bacterium]
MMCKLSKNTIDDILQKGRIYEVGGAVRDRFLLKEKPTKDRDYLVTGIPYDELSRILKTHGRVDLVGRSFGVIKFTQFKSGIPHTFDITLPRKEYSVGVGHTDFKVDFDPNLKVEEDLLRRDFTINAMAYALDNKELVDPVGGRLDLEKRQLRMVYKDSFKDDPLRMLRAIQFAARFNFIVEPETFKALREYASLIKTVSSERIAEELNKLLKLSEKPSEGFRLMLSSGILKEILPELEECVGVDQPGGYHKYDVFEHTLHVIDACRRDLTLRMAALFHDINKPQHKRVVDKGATFYGHEVSGAKTAKTVLKRLKYPTDFIRNVSILVARHMFTTDVSDKGLRRLIKKFAPANPTEGGEEVNLIFDLLDLRRADVIGQGMGGTTEDVDELEARIREELNKKPPFSISDLALNGNDIMKLFKLKPGPRVGKILDYLMEQVLDNPQNNNREKLESFAREYCLTRNKNIINNKESD